MSNENIAITNYAEGHITQDGGAALDRAAKRYMDKSGDKDYRRAINEAIIGARAELREDRAEFRSRTRNYQSHFRINEAEAVRRVAEHDPKMKALYESDPFGPVIVTDTPPPPAKADITMKPWEPPIHENIAIIQIANILFGLPRDEFGFISLDAAREALRSYGDLLLKAVSEKLDAYARAGISILGLPNFSSENYPAGFRWALAKYPSLAALYSAGKLTSQSLRDLLPQILIND